MGFGLSEAARMLFSGNAALLMTAVIWGFSFVAQRTGMEFVGPFTFNGVRFALGALSLLPLIFLFRNKQAHAKGISNIAVAKAGAVLGIILIFAASLQQVGLVYTTAGKAAFITCLYIILVPMAALLLKQPVSKQAVFGGIIAVIGLYLLCVKETSALSYGDFLELIGAFFWTAHIIMIGKYSGKMNGIQLAFYQFTVCSVISLIIAALTEEIILASILAAWIPIAYGGILTVGLAYTLQIIGQQRVEPSLAAILLSMETVFAAIGGYWLLDEILSTTEFIGMLLMFAGMLTAQMRINMKRKVQ